MDKMIESLLNKGYTYDSLRENNHFSYYDGFDADVDFWYGKYSEDVDAGVADPDVGVVEYIAGKIENDHPTDSPEQFESLMRWVRSELKNLEMNEAQIGGVQQFTNGEASGRALAGENADKGVRDVTDGTNGRGKAEVDKTGVYVGVPASSVGAGSPDQTAWANPVAVRQALPNVAGRATQYQKAFAAAPAAEKAQMADWSPEKPDMSMNSDAKVVDNNTGKIMPTTKAAPAPAPKSSILGKIGKAMGLTESKLKESYDDSEEVTTDVAEKTFCKLKMSGIWNMLVETENYRFHFYSNDMDPSRWFANANSKRRDDGYNHCFYPNGKSHYSELGSYNDLEGDDKYWPQTPMGLIRKYYEEEYEKIVKVETNKKHIDLEEAVTYGVCAVIKKKPLVKLSYKAAADRLIRDEIAKVCEPYGTKESYRTVYPNVWDMKDGFELVDKLADDCVKNIKAAKKAAAAARKAAKEGIEMTKNQLFESILREGQFDPEKEYVSNLEAAAEQLGCRCEGGWYGIGLEGSKGDLSWAFCMSSTPAYGLETYFITKKGGHVSVMNASAGNGKDRVTNPKNTVKAIVEFVNDHLEDATKSTDSKVDILKQLENRLSKTGYCNDIWLDGDKLKVFADPRFEDDIYDVFADFRDENSPEHDIDYHIARGDMEEDGTDEILYAFNVEF